MTLNGGAADVGVSDHRVAFTTTGGELIVKDGLYGTWHDETGRFNQYALSDELLVIRTGDGLYGKTGLVTPWAGLAGAVADVRVAGSRIAYTDTGGSLWTKEGLYSGWVHLYGSTAQYAIS